MNKKTHPDMIALRDRNDQITGYVHLDTRCWCSHTLGQHYSTHCIEGCPCGGDYPPRLPEGKQGFSQAQPEPTASTCFRCDAELDPARGSVKNALCDLCRRKLQAKVCYVASRMLKPDQVGTAPSVAVSIACLPEKSQ